MPFFSFEKHLALTFSNHPQLFSEFAVVDEMGLSTIAFVLEYFLLRDSNSLVRTCSCLVRWKVVTVSSFNSQIAAY